MISTLFVKCYGCSTREEKKIIDQPEENRTQNPQICSFESLQWNRKWFYLFVEMRHILFAHNCSVSQKLAFCSVIGRMGIHSNLHIFISMSCIGLPFFSSTLMCTLHCFYFSYSVHFLFHFATHCPQRW